MVIGSFMIKCKSNRWNNILKKVHILWNKIRQKCMKNKGSKEKINNIFTNNIIFWWNCFFLNSLGFTEVYFI